MDPGGERSKFRLWAGDVTVWAAALFPEGGRKLLEDAAKCKTDFDDSEDIDDI